jgi:hypothetical protein
MKNTETNMRLLTWAGFLFSMAAVNGASLELAQVTVGSNLQAATSVKLSEPAPDGGIEITVTSEAPSKVRFAKRPDQGGGDSLTLTVPAGFKESPEFWVQGMDVGEEVPYTATAPGFGNGTGSVILTPSAIVIAGPYRGPRFPTTTGAAPSRIVVYAVRLDSSSEVAERQLVAGGVSAEVELVSSNENVGAFVTSRLTITGGSSGAGTEFKPASAGSTTLSLSVPPGFTTPPATISSIVADVALPGLSLLDELMIGHNLQIAGNVGLGEAAHTGGVQVTLTSEDSELLLLSKSAVEVGSKSIVLSIPENGVSAQFFLQALGKAGRVGYSATAAGHRPRASKVILTPSGVVIAPKPYGPPDEAELFRKGNEAEGERGFVSHLSKVTKMPLAVWTAQLDPVTLRSADITVQPLRGGMSLKVDVKVSDPALARVVSPVTIQGGSEHGSSEFTPIAKGAVAITAVTPAGFTTSANSTTVNAIDKD